MGIDLKITDQIQDYINTQGLKLHPVQSEIIEYNKKLGNDTRMQISINQANFLYLLIKVSGILKILEIGTFTGFSSLSMALALPEDGLIITLDKNKQTNEIAKNFFLKAKQDKKIKTIVKPAEESLEELKNQLFDLIFIDADKLNYKKYYDKSLELLKKSGLIVIDNVLWHGEIVDEKINDKFTISLREFNQYIANDKRVEKVIIPLGDGMTVCRKL
ncbi:MAG: O-methyltransferase [Pelagibacteraceae bacterium]